jgi:hypothetical protein
MTVVAILIAIAMLGNASGAAKQRQSPREEFPFNRVGTVSKHGVDTCMQGHILYDLNSLDHKTKDWLSTSSKSDDEILQKAMNNGGWVRVKGTMMVGVEANCKWVAVSNVTPVKKK